jgi:hypothetical protein
MNDLAAVEIIRDSGNLRIKCDFIAKESSNERRAYAGIIASYTPGGRIVEQLIVTAFIYENPTVAVKRMKDFCKRIREEECSLEGSLNEHILTEENGEGIIKLANNVRDKRKFLADLVEDIADKGLTGIIRNSEKGQISAGVILRASEEGTCCLGIITQHKKDEGIDILYNISTQKSTAVTLKGLQKVIKFIQKE